nr:MAG TPA: alpha-1, 3-glucanase [Caudoviricetes sp.]
MNTKTITPLPPANFTPEMGNYRALQPFRYWCQKVLPLVYDDSLSYYELLCKVVDYLNKTMEDVETLHGDVNNLHTAYEQLQNYVNMYFSSLDVQKEIDNKLDQMANDGTLNILLQMHARMVLPSGDTSGNTDAKNIQSMLDKFGYVELFTGIYYINEPIKLKSGNTIIGSGNENTVIECSSDFCIFNENNSADKLVLKNFRVNDTTGEHIGLNFIGTTVTPYTGIRYSFIENVHLFGFNMCVDIRGAWCVKFNHCRFESDNMCVKQSGTCNNIEYTECQFYGLQNVSTGVRIIGDGGAENYGIYFNNCDFEKHKYGFNLYSCVGVYINDLYVEKIDTVINADNAINLVLNGGTLNTINRVANVAKSQTNNFYNVTTFTMLNTYIRYNKTEKSCLVYISDNVPVYIENITVTNLKGGKVYLKNTDAETNFDYNGDYYIENISTSNFNGRYTTSKGVLLKTDGIKRRNSVKLIGCNIELIDGATVDNNTEVRLVNENGTVLYRFYVNSGTYESGHIFNGEVVCDTYDLINRGVNLSAFFTTPTGNTNIQFKCNAKFAIGEMEPRAQVLIITNQVVETDV